MLTPKSKESEARALLPQLTTVQKVRLLSGASVWTTKPIPHLNLPSLWLCDGPHGLRKQEQAWVTDLVSGRVDATCFPTASCLACSWNPELLEKIGQALARECKYHRVPVLLGPGINLIRHPCGGRNFEYYSEDPYLTSRLAAALVTGIQSLGVGTSLKHLFCNNQEKWRNVVNVVVDERTQKELYERAFEYVVKTAQPWTVMTAYNQVNGDFCSEHPMVTKTLRGDWGFEGLVMTDWGATNNRVKGIRNGIDLEMPGSLGAFDDLVLQALKNGELSEDHLDDCAVRVLSLILLCKEQLQHIDEETGSMTVDYDAHHKLAREAALESTVLLKNENYLLPLAENASVAVIGAFAKEPRFQGMGSSEVQACRIDCVWDSITKYTKNVLYAPGYDRGARAGVNQPKIDEAVNIAKEADVVLLFCGLTEICESEAFDRASMDLDSAHDKLIEAVSKANSNTVVILSNGAPVSMPWANQVPTILESWLGGQGGAYATVELIFGKASPSGKLAQTFAHRLADIPCDKWFPGVDRIVQYREGLNVGYRYFNSANADVLFPFGHGLSYTSFQLRNLVIKTAPSVGSETQITVQLEVENVGPMSGAEVIQCYVHDCDSSVYRPHHELKAFKKIFLEPLQTETICLMLKSEAFCFWDVSFKKWIIEDGDFEIQIGCSSRDIRLRATVSLSTGQECSLEARQSHPTMLLQERVFDSDDHFKAMLGHPVPSAETVSRFHHNSLLVDAQTTFTGRMILASGLRAMNSHLKGPPDEHHIKFANEIVSHTPFRGLVLWSKGGLTFPLLELLIHIMHGEFLSLLWKTPSILCVYLYQLMFVRKNRI